MNRNRGESQAHLEAKPAIGFLFDDPGWSVFFEHCNADVLALHHASRFVSGIEIEASPRNVLRNIERNMANGCHAVAVVSLTDRYLNQIKNKIQKHLDPHHGRPTKVFSFNEPDLLNLREWIEQLAQSHTQNTGENR